MDKKQIWTEVHSIVRVFPCLFAYFKAGGMNSENMLLEIQKLKDRLYIASNHANKIGGYYKHYVNLIRAEFDIFNILCLNEIDSITKDMVDKWAYHTQWNLLDLTGAELNRSE